MTQVKVSTKFQIVIPKEVREQISLRMGQKLAMVVKEGIITLVPDRPITTFRGFLKGMRAGAVREKRERM